MNILANLFRTSAPAPAPAPAPQQSNTNPVPNTTTLSTPNTAPNSVIPDNGSTAPPSPLEKHKDLWEDDANSGTNTGFQQPNVDPQKILEAAKTVDFSKVLDQESLAAVAAGGENAVAALVKVLNSHAQAVYGQAAVAADKIVTARLEAAQNGFQGNLPRLIRDQQAKQSLFEENPAFANPTVAPVVEAIADRLAVKYPKATPSELKAMAKEVLQGTAQTINPGYTPDNSRSRQAPKDDSPNWADYLTGDQIDPFR